MRRCPSLDQMVHGLAHAGRTIDIDKGVVLRSHGAPKGNKREIMRRR